MGIKSRESMILEMQEQIIQLQGQVSTLAKSLRERQRIEDRILGMIEKIIDKMGEVK